MHSHVTPISELIRGQLGTACLTVTFTSTVNHRVNILWQSHRRQTTVSRHTLQCSTGDQCGNDDQTLHVQLKLRPSRWPICIQSARAATMQSQCHTLHCVKQFRCTADGWSSVRRKNLHWSFMWLNNRTVVLFTFATHACNQQLNNNTHTICTKFLTMCIVQNKQTRLLLGKRNNATVQTSYVETTKEPLNETQMMKCTVLVGPLNFWPGVVCQPYKETEIRDVKC